MDIYGLRYNPVLLCYGVQIVIVALLTPIFLVSDFFVFFFQCFVFSTYFLVFQDVWSIFDLFTAQILELVISPKISGFFHGKTVLETSIWVFIASGLSLVIGTLFYNKEVHV